MSENSVELWTYQDAMNHLIDVFSIEPRGKVERNAMRAILDAYRELPRLHPWNYFHRRGLITTSAHYETGTIAYDHTGGTNEREVTLTTGTWPTWAKYGVLLYDSVRYEVDDRVSATVITLKDDSNPGADIAAGASYSIFRAAYPLPIGASKISGLVELKSGYPVDLVSDETLLRQQIGNFSPQRPYSATVRSTGKYPGRMEIEFGPPPSTARNFDMVYESAPRKLQIREYSVGTAATTSGAATLTCASAAFTSDFVGAVVRLAANSNELPTSQIGQRAGASATIYNPFVFESVVKSQDSATVLTMEDNADATYSATSYTISDRVDIEAGAMLDLFKCMIEFNFARYERKPRVEVKDMEERKLYELRSAMAADNRFKTGSPMSAQTRYYDLEDWASGTT